MKKQSYCPRSACSVLTVATLSTVTAFLLSSQANAQQWTLAPEVGVGFEYDDNARLQSNPVQVEEIDGYLFEGSLGVNYATPRTSLDIIPRLLSRVYDETPDVDSNDQFLRVNFNHEGLKSDFRIRGSYARESVRTAERTDDDVDVDDPDEIPIDDSGDVSGNERRNRFFIAPEWTYELTERMSFRAQYQYQDADYDDAVVVTHTDYTNQRLGVFLDRALSQRTRGYISAFGRKYENELEINDVDGIGLGLGFTSELSQTTRVQAEIGYENTERALTGETSSNWLGNINIVRRLETVTLLAQYRRDIGAGGSGEISTRDSVNLNLNKQFSERFAAGFGVRAYRREALEDQTVTATNQRDFARFFAKVELALSQAFWLEGEYRYDYVDRSNVEGDAHSNGIILWLVYRPTPIVN